MSTSFFSVHHLPQQNHHHFPFLRRPKTQNSIFLSKSLPKSQITKWVLKSSSVEQQQSQSLNGLVDFLYEDLPHLFDDQGIDAMMYDDRVKFRDPITKHDTIGGYLFNIGLLKGLFRPEFQLHSVRQTGPYEITTRWTMVMTFVLLPWKPQLVFTGISVMGVNPKTQKFCSHVDLWDSIENNDYFSFEGFLDVLKQLRYYKTPDLESPKYQILKRTAIYEVRKYDPFVVAETKGEKLSGSSGFNDVAGYIFGKNSTNEKIPMTTPVFTQAVNDKLSEVSIQIVLPMNKELENLPSPAIEAVKLRKVEGGIAAAMKFSGKPTEEVVFSKEKELRSALLKAGLKPREGCMLARYNDPGRTWSFIMDLTYKMSKIHPIDLNASAPAPPSFNIPDINSSNRSTTSGSPSSGSKSLDPLMIIVSGLLFSIFVLLLFYFRAIRKVQAKKNKIQEDQKRDRARLAVADHIAAMSTVERGKSSSMGTTREPPPIGIRAVRQDTTTQFPEEPAIQVQQQRDPPSSTSEPKSLKGCINCCITINQR